jgi:NAD(P)-dependent dehydrogenase (short-subunit alcohol dehydrogenase family)
MSQRVAVITGAGRGIGAAVAELLAAQGLAVVVNDLGSALDGSGADPGPAAAVAERIRRAGGRAIHDSGDVADHAVAGRLVQRARAEFGRLDVLVNVAGILRDRMIFNMTEQEWDAVIRVHLRGTFNTTRHAAAHWRTVPPSQPADPSPHRRIINFTSVSGLRGAAGQPNYAAAKMGIVGLTYSCANALARFGVTVNAVSPGAVTRMTDTMPTEKRASNLAAEMTPENVAPLVGYLASEASDWLTGQVVSAEGLEIGLYNRPEQIRTVRSTEPWTAEGIAAAIESSFRPAVEGRR